ncbi:hypothetical protein H072_11446 [Dactylellina haptotyla CBS 200.50]|uniref:Uncharacterized protein n=1 Tax=Dactylellina haptotyla (strain CBS 200.50) TaxID=1284197 RepID=S8BIY3_DACHA|nr:hypothetical protein H072_11446 [Dactylellina haptotyla CBS 200.50]
MTSRPPSHFENSVLEPIETNNIKGPTSGSVSRANREREPSSHTPSRKHEDSEAQAQQTYQYQTHPNEHDLTDRRLSGLIPARTTIEALGIYGICAITMGSIVVLGAFGFLVALWYEGSRAAANIGIPIFWQIILLRNWSAQAVTICAVCIRTAVVVQIGLAVAMIASLICERVGCHPAQLAQFSVIRSVGTGPHSLVLPLIYTTTRWSKHHAYIFLVFVYLSVMVLSQFTSTILISDFGALEMADTAKVSNIKYGVKADLQVDSLPVSLGLSEDNEFSRGTRLIGVDPWVTGLQYYPRFAEWSEAPIIGKQFYDTGNVFRAFLPVKANTERQLIRNYSGPATIVNSRVICVPPILENPQIWSLNEELNFQSAQNTYLISEVEWARVFQYLTRIKPGQYTEYTGEKASFNCSIFQLPTMDQLDTASSQEWEVSICYSPLPLARITDPFPDILRLNFVTDTYIVINSTGFREDIRNLTGGETVSGSGPWATLKKKGIPASIDISLCFVKPEMGDYNVLATGVGDISEPELYWDSQINLYSSGSIRNVLGVTDSATRLPALNRGLWELAHPRDWGSSLFAKSTISYFSYGAVADALWLPSSTTGGDAAVKLVGGNLESRGYRVHRAHTTLFRDTIMSTRNPALAIQALLTVLMEIVYYDYQAQFNTEAPASIILSTTINAPTGWRGVIIVGMILGSHFVLFSFILWLFFAKTEVSMLGNYWMGVSQAVSGDTSKVVALAADKTDEGVRKWYKEHEPEISSVRICTASEPSMRSEAKYRKL